MKICNYNSVRNNSLWQVFHDFINGKNNKVKFGCHLNVVGLSSEATLVDMLISGNWNEM